MRFLPNRVEFVIQIVKYPFEVYPTRLMRCKICQQTFHTPPPRMRDDQICTECKSKMISDENHHKDEKNDITTKAKQLEEKIEGSKIEENKKKLIEIPLADNLESLINLVELISKNIIYPEELAKRLGIEVRQIMYYTQAAQMLDLLKQYQSDSNHFYKITSFGKNLLIKREPVRFYLLGRKIKKIPLFEQLLKRLESKGVIQKQEVSHFIFTNSNLSTSSAELGASSFMNWIHMAELGIKKDDKIFSHWAYRDFKFLKENQIKSIPKETYEENQIKSIPKETYEEFLAKNISDKDPTLIFNECRKKLLESIKNSDSEYFFKEMEKRIRRMSKRQITKLFKKI